MADLREESSKKNIDPLPFGGDMVSWRTDAELQMISLRIPEESRAAHLLDFGFKPHHKSDVVDRFTALEHWKLLLEQPRDDQFQHQDAAVQQAVRQLDPVERVFRFAGEQATFAAQRQAAATSSYFTDVTHWKMKASQSYAEAISEFETLVTEAQRHGQVPTEQTLVLSLHKGLGLQVEVAH